MLLNIAFIPTSDLSRKCAQSTEREGIRLSCN